MEAEGEFFLVFLGRLQRVLAWLLLKELTHRPLVFSVLLEFALEVGYRLVQVEERRNELFLLLLSDHALLRPDKPLFVVCTLQKLHFDAAVLDLADRELEILKVQGHRVVCVYLQPFFCVQQLAVGVYLWRGAQVLAGKLLSLLHLC